MRTEEQRIIVSNLRNKDWSNMSITAMGISCKSCNKTVIDFSWAIDKIKNYFKNTNQNMCGYFKSLQIIVKRLRHHQFTVDIYYKTDKNLKMLKLKSFLLSFTMLIMFLVGCNNPSESNNKKTGVVATPKLQDNIDSSVIKIEQRHQDELNLDSLILNLTKQVLISFRNKDYNKFSDFIHPIFGIRFSPYSYVNTESDMKFTREKFVEELKTQNKFIWGTYDGGDESIFLTLTKYLKSIADGDYLNAEKTSVNKVIGGEGSNNNNIEEIYPKCDFSESYYSGLDKELVYTDWHSLRIVFKKYEKRYYVVGIVEDQWTI